MLNFLVLTNEQLEALCYINVSRGKQSGNLVVRCRWPNTHKKRLGSWEGMVFTSCMRCQVLWRDIVFTKIIWNSFCFSQAFVLSGKEPTDLHKVEMILENTWMHGWTPRTSSTVLLHGAFVLRLKSQQHVFLTWSQISHHWLKHLTKLLSFSEGDLSSICNYKLPVLPLNSEDKVESKVCSQCHKFPMYTRNSKHFLCRLSGRINYNCSLQSVELCWFTSWEDLFPCVGQV